MVLDTDHTDGETLVFERAGDISNRADTVASREDVLDAFDDRTIAVRVSLADRWTIAIQRGTEIELDNRIFEPVSEVRRDAVASEESLIRSVADGYHLMVDAEHVDRDRALYYIIEPVIDDE